MKGLLIIGSLGIVAMLAEIFKFKKLLYPLTLLGIIAAYIFNFMDWNTDWKMHDPFPLFSNMILFDNAALAFSGVILITSLLWFILSRDFFSNESSRADHFSLVLFSICGALMLTAFNNLCTLFLGIEILSIPLYVLAAGRKSDPLSNEAGFKYLIMGSFASAFLLFGIALVYGATGSFDLITIANYTKTGDAPVFFYTGIVILFSALCFKVSAAPFHFWAPDVYQGSPTVITALMSTVVKTSAFAAFMRLFVFGFGGAAEHWAPLLAIIIALSLIISNFTAASQNNVKRMLAYSSISHAAFMLMAILINSPEVSPKIILYYSLAYSIGSIATFTVLYLVGKSGSENIEAFDGLSTRNPFLAVGMLFALLSLAGIPVTAGFFAKYYVLSSLAATGYKWVLILAIISSCVGVYYYFKVIIAMYFKKSKEEGSLVIEGQHVLLIAITSLLTLLLGLMPDIILKM